MRAIAPGAEAAKSLNLPLIPMIDVFMNLLCFFLVAGHFKMVEHELASELPKESSTNLPRPDDPLPELWIRIQNGGNEANPIARIEIDGRPVANWAAADGLLARYARLPNARRETRVIVAPDKDAEHGWVMHVLGVLQDLGFRSINFKQ